jgi:TP901 family phage tail tape measure protein
MARGRQTLTQRIALDGGKEIERELKALGKNGERAFRELQKAANQVKGPGPAFIARLKQIQREMSRVGDAFVKAGTRIRHVGRNFTTFVTLPIVAGATAAVKAATDFESAMTDVRKVVDFPTPVAFKQLADDLRELSLRLPVSATGLADIAAAAGQAGIPAEQLLSFTELVAQASVAFGLTAEEAGQALAKIKTALNLTIPEVRLLSDAMNTLANNMAASETDVLEVVRRTAALGEVAGVATKDIAAIGAAMVSMGVESERAATAVRNILLNVQAGANATKAQNKAWEQLGLTATEVAKRIQKEGAGVILEIFERINRKAPEVRASILQALFDKRAVDAAGPLINNLNVLRRAFELVSDEAEFGGSTLREFAIRADTAANKFQLFKNALNNAAIVIGAELLPVVVSLLEKLSALLKSFAGLPDATRKWIVEIAGVTAVVGPLTIVLGVLVSSIGTLLKFGARLLQFFRFLSVAALAHPLGAVIAAVAALAGALILLRQRNLDNEEAAKAHAEAMDEIRERLQQVKDGVPGAIEALREKADADLAAARAAIEHAKAEVTAQRQIAEARFIAGRGGRVGRPGGSLEAEFEERRGALGKLEEELAEAERTLDEQLTTLKELQATLGAETKRTVADLDKGVGDAAGGAAGQVEKLGRTITVTRAGADGLTKQTFEIVDGIARAVKEAGDGAKTIADSAEKAAKAATDLGDNMRHVAQAARPATPLADAEAAAAGPAGQPATDTDAALAAIERARQASAAAVEEIRAQAASIATLWSDARAQATGALDAIAVATGALAQNVSSQLTAAALNVSGAFQGLAAAVGAAFSGVVAAIRGQFASLQSAVESVVARLVSELNRLKAAIASARAAAGAAGSGATGSFARGGAVRGPGTSTSDSISAWLSHGEYVISAPAVSRYGVGLMDAINRLRLPSNAFQGFSAVGLADAIGRSMSALRSTAPRFAAGGLAVSGGGGRGRSMTVNLAIGGQTFGPFQTDEEVAGRFVRFAMGAQARSAGRAPGYIGA